MLYTYVRLQSTYPSLPPFLFPFSFLPSLSSSHHFLFPPSSPNLSLLPPTSPIPPKAIHDKIVSLSLSQVHTKIKQVDSHASLSNSIGPGIVVQVTGEISVAGNPMRPFVQTFVLAPQSAKKYYIHNDIFRYQFYDEDLVSECELNEPLAGGEGVEGHIEMGVGEVVKSPSLPEEAHYHQEHTLQPTVLVEQGKISPVPSGSTGRPEPAGPSAWMDPYQHG